MKALYYAAWVLLYGAHCHTVFIVVEKHNVPIMFVFLIPLLWVGCTNIMYLAHRFLEEINHPTR